MQQPINTHSNTVFNSLFAQIIFYQDCSFLYTVTDIPVHSEKALKNEFKS